MLTIPKQTKPENTMTTQDFIPTLVIGVGATGAFFTLRQTYQSFGGGIRSYHLFNLSQDPTEAVAKATEYSKVSGTPLWVNEDKLAEEMREIQRATAQERQARLDRQAADEAECARLAEEAKQVNLKLLADGKFAFGQYYGHLITEAPRGYLTWLADKVETFEEGSFVRMTAEKIIAEYSSRLFPQPANAHIGVVGQRQVFQGTVVKVSYFTRPAHRGWGEEVVWVSTIVVDHTHECLVVFSTAFRPDAGDELVFKATVKEHSEYKGLKQTIVQRVTVTAHLTALKNAI